MDLVLYGLIGFVVALLLWWVSALNRYARLENLLRESWANVDVALKRRHDLIPNLVETVRAYAAHEREVLERVVAARGSLREGDLQTESELARAVTSLLARVEAYPQLRASASFAELQKELVNTEDRIAAARRFYNANVRDYNVLLESFPSSLASGGRRPREFFEVESIELRRVPSTTVG